MRKTLLILALLAPVAAFGQTFSTGGRASVGVDYKAFKGFHVSVDEEVRSGDNFSQLGSMRTNVSVSYKPITYLKVGVGYTLINPYKRDKEIISGADTTLYSGFWSPRHRFYADVSGHLKLGHFSLALKERIQFTHNTDYGINLCQSTRNAVASKTKLSVKYNGLEHITPYAAFEVRAALNEPWGKITEGPFETDKGKKYYLYSPSGSKAYINRLRLNLGVEFEPAPHHVFEPYILLDYTRDYVIDTNSPSKWADKGIRLWTATTGWQSGFMATFGLNYVFKF